MTEEHTQENFKELLDLVVRDRDKYKELWNNFPTLDEDLAYQVRILSEENFILKEDIKALTHSLEMEKKVENTGLCEFIYLKIKGLFYDKR